MEKDANYPAKALPGLWLRFIRTLPLFNGYYWLAQP